MSVFTATQTELRRSLTIGVMVALLASAASSSYFSSRGESVHQVSSEAGEESIIYVRTDGKYDVIPAK